MSPQPGATVVPRRPVRLPRPEGRTLPPVDLRHAHRAPGGRRLVPGAQGPASAVGGAGPRGRERPVARNAAAAVAARSTQRAVHAAGRERHPAARRQGRQRPLPRLRPDHSAPPRRNSREAQEERRPVRGNGGAAGRPRAGRLMAAAADRADSARPAARSPDMAGNERSCIRCIIPRKA
jgi:hypothetical protein